MRSPIQFLTWQKYIYPKEKLSHQIHEAFDTILFCYIIHLSFIHIYIMNLYILHWSFKHLYIIDLYLILLYIIHLLTIHLYNIHLYIIHLFIIYLYIINLYLMQLTIFICMDLSICTYIQYNVPENHFHKCTFVQLYIDTSVYL